MPSSIRSLSHPCGATETHYGGGLLSRFNIQSNLASSVDILHSHSDWQPRLALGADSHARSRTHTHTSAACRAWSNTSVRLQKQAASFCRGGGRSQWADLPFPPYQPAVCSPPQPAGADQRLPFTSGSHSECETNPTKWASSSEMER